MHIFFLKKCLAMCDELRRLNFSVEVRINFFSSMPPIWWRKDCLRDGYMFSFGKKIDCWTLRNEEMITEEKYTTIITIYSHSPIKQPPSKWAIIQVTDILYTLWFRPEKLYDIVHLSSCDIPSILLYLVVYKIQESSIAFCTECWWLSLCEGYMSWKGPSIRIF